ncbi:CDP-alcohol phosphatidyltransferase family protein [Homoserinibacter sp. GY 40078]|uniref:CDP-alcohol phosphatidyltransferase family protein n=1 Tax=Homoserinibacter sp. GY 40078 TaxID=2603275 RepID=UPI0011C81D4C|nr:CDP-alcohol phosphatidyltransferase family protein [Homoserinibacter sp. GY 40078]TXK17728.1 CDP-alcohol phosphatidyltransferase family protein [Homoserinibacter sp. GY 40078]
MTRVEAAAEAHVRPRFGETLARMSAAQKPGRGAPPYSRWINRRMGRVIAAAAYTVGATPNQVTAASAALTTGALVVIALVEPVWWLGFVVAGLLVLGYAFDAADGQLARLRGGGSRAGEWLDHMVDVTKTCALHAVVLISFFRFGGIPGEPFLLIPLGYLTVSIVLFFGIMLVDQLRRQAAAQGAAPAAPSGGSGLLQTLVALPADYGILCIAFFLFGVTPAFLVAYTLLFIGHTVVLLGALARWWRQLRALDAEASRA